MKWRRIGVLMGGMSAEREVSLIGGRAVVGGLKRSGYDVVEIDTAMDLDIKLREARVDAVFIVLHGPWGEDGAVQGMLEMMGIPYTGSGVTASAVAMDKVLTRNLLTAHGLSVAEGFTVHDQRLSELPDGWKPPVVVKPACDGSSVGITIVRKASEFANAVSTAFECADRVLVEKFIGGAEVTVAVLHGKALGALEVEAHREFYDYKAKYEEGGATHHIPPRISEASLSTCMNLSTRAYNLLGCHGAARVDLIVPDGEPPVILEVNTIPGMTELSLLPDIAKACGLTFDALVAEIMESATLHVGRSARPSAG